MIGSPFKANPRASSINVNPIHGMNLRRMYRLPSLSMYIIAIIVPRAFVRAKGKL